MFLRAAVLFAFLALLAGCAPDAAECGSFGLPCCAASATQPACYSGLVCVPHMGTPGTCSDTLDAAVADAADGGSIGRDASADVARDTAVAMDTGGDAARDAAAPDVVVDGTPADVRSDVFAMDQGTDAVAAADAGVDAPTDMGTDVARDTAVVETGADATPADTTPADATLADAAPADAAPADAALDTAVGVDASVDVPADNVDAGVCNTCTLGTYRCSPTTGDVERCGMNAGGCLVFATATTCSSPAGLREVCVANACTLCSVPAGGAPGCAVICASNSDCHDRGYARCSLGGGCARRGYLRCTTSADCAGFSTGTVSSSCTLDVVVDGVPARVCDGTNVTRCSADSMCTQSTHCNLATGFCQ